MDSIRSVYSTIIFRGCMEWTMILLTALASQVTFASVQSEVSLLKPLDINDIPLKIVTVYNQLREVAKNGTLNLAYVEYLYYDTLAIGRYDSKLIEKNKERLRTSLGVKFDELSQDSQLNEKHLDYLKSRIRFYPDLHVRQALGRASSKNILVEKKFAYCADFSKAFIEYGLRNGVSEKNFAVLVMAEKKSLLNVCPERGVSPLLNQGNLSGIYFGMTYVVMIRETGIWYLVNPEAPMLEVFRVGKQTPNRGTEIEFPYFTSLGASPFVISGRMNLNLFLSGYDIAVPTDIGISGVVGERSLCR